MKPEEIKELRLSRGETQGEFGAALDLSTTAASVCAWELGKRRPLPSRLKELSALRDAKAPVVGLAAAAPDMLAALEEFCEAFATLDIEVNLGVGLRLGAIIEHATAAIAKAKGETDA